MSDAAHDTRDTWLVGYLYNNNGMGTWCWEAAHALAAAGERVVLVCSDTVTLPGPTDIPVLRVAASNGARSLPGKVMREVGRLSARGPRVMRDAVAALERDGTRVCYLLLNSTEFHDRGISAPQLVTAWAREASLGSYLGRLRPRLRGLDRESVRVSLDTLGWWRKDWRGYREADCVLAVSRPLVRELAARGVRVSLLHPCTHVDDAQPHVSDPASPLRLVTSAVHLDEPRKRVGWMLDALREWKGRACTLTLIGAPSDALRRQAALLPMPVEFTGALPRDVAMQRVREHDVFLFASALDDWGYVITEAMAEGLAVIAPDTSPFDEILGDTGALYPLDSGDGFRRALERIGGDVTRERRASIDRARSEFSRAAFTTRLFEIVRGIDVSR